MKRLSLTSRRIVVCALVGALSACSGGGGGSTAVPTSNGLTNTPTNGGSVSPSSSLTTTLVPQPKIATASQAVGPSDAAMLTMHVVVNKPNGLGLSQYAAAVNDPSDGRYRQFLTPQQIADQFGATAADYQTVAKYFASYGLRVGMWPQRLALTVAGPRQRFEKALGTTFVTRRAADGTMLTAPNGAIHFSQPLPVREIANAVAAPSNRTLKFLRGAGGGETTNGLGMGYTPQQVTTAFDFTGAFAAGFTGKGINVGIIGTGPFMQADSAAYRSTYGFGGSGTVTQVNVTPQAAANTYTGGPIAYGGSPTATPPPVTAPCSAHDSPYLSPSESPTSTCNPEDFEAQIDTQQASLAPDANVLFYLAYVPSECYDPTVPSCTKDPSTGNGYSAQGLAEADDEIEQAIADNRADILSLSYGGAEPLFGSYYVQNFATGQYDPMAFGPSEFAALSAEGIATFVSTGDAGAEGCAPFSVSMENTPCLQYPSSDVGVTAVGGVTVPLNNAGQLLGPITVWGQQTKSGGGTGGGVSSIIPKPAWQTGTNISGSLRSVPDVSLLGDPETGVAVFANTAFNTGHLSQYGGTSVAAPQMAAMWALVLDACRQTATCNRSAGAKSYRLGNAAPYFYKVYNNAAQYQSSFYDVLFGNNGVIGCQQNGTCRGTPTPGPGYQAGQGYDLSTGVGVPFARHLIQSVVGV